MHVRTVQAVRSLVFALLLLLSIPGSSAARSPADTLGVYRGAGNQAAVAGWEAWLGNDAHAVTDYFLRKDWGELLNPWLTSQWAGSQHRVVYGLALIPEQGGSLEAAAGGAYNERFREVARQLVAAGQGGAILRLGFEFTGNWFPWSAGPGEGQRLFAEAWRQIVGAMRSVPGANFKFDWCPTLHGSWYEGRQLDPAGAYPGDQWVDYIGMDVYDQDWMQGWNKPRSRWRNLKKSSYGLVWHRDFARSHRKPMTFPEWGLAQRADGHGGGDNPYFIRKMHRWIASNPVAYHMYFEFDEADSYHELMSGRFPRAAAVFRRLFG